MHTIEQLSSAIEAYISALPLPAHPVGLYDPIRYSLKSGGKRVRPLLVLLSCDLFGGDIRAALPCAAALEVYHNFTLLHDDIMDNAPVRRGRPAVHRQWDTNTAILSGDAMVIYAYRLLEHLPAEQLVKVITVFNRCCMDVCAGQQYDMEFEKRADVSLDEYMEMIALKTSALLAGGAKMGAIVAGARSEDCEALYQFALQLGLAFQIQDDLLDAYGSAAQLGKETGRDIVEGKKSFLLLRALELADTATAKELKALILDSEIEHRVKIDAVCKIYDSLGMKLVAEREVEARMGNAMVQLEGLDVPQERKDSLREFALSLIKRQR